MTTGCDKRVNEQDCNEAFFPDKRDANWNKIRACYWNKKQKYCENLHYRQDEYNAIVNKRFDQKQWDKDHKLEETQDTGQAKYTFKPDKSTKDEAVAIATSIDLDAINLYNESQSSFKMNDFSKVSRDYATLGGASGCTGKKGDCSHETLKTRQPQTAGAKQATD